MSRRQASLTRGNRVKVVKILNADRAAGMSTCKKPPRRIIGRIGTIHRLLTSWDAWWVRFGRPIRRRSHEYKWATSKKEREYLKRHGRAWEFTWPEQYVFTREELVRA